MISKIIDKLKHKVCHVINLCAFHVFKLFPIKTNTIILESEGDLCDNAYALYDYMISNNYDKKYEIIWLVDHIEKYSGNKFLSKNVYNLNLRLMYYLAVSKYYIYDHNNLLMYMKKRKEQNIVYLSHGFGFKKGTLKNKDKIKTEFDIMIVTGDLPAKGNSLFWQSDINKVQRLGYPRLDYFFKNNDESLRTLDKAIHINDYGLKVLWMPTFRQSINKDLSQDYIDNETGLPILNTKDSIEEFNNYLKQNNILFILKLHHLQSELEVFKSNFSNILILRDEDLTKLNIQLYQFVSLTDALITDYSSISVDYLLLDRPIIYTLDDYDQYNSTRGIYPENAIDYMPGYHVYSLNELIESIDEINSGIDKYKESRKKVLPVFFTHQDGNSSKRILEYLNITKEEL